MRSKHLIPLLAIVLLSALVGNAQDAKQQLNDQFWEAVRKGDITQVTALLDKGADVNAKFRYGATALFKAAERGHLEVVKLLLARGAEDRKSTRLNSSHTVISYAVFCLKKKKK